SNDLGLVTGQGPQGPKGDKGDKGDMGNKGDATLPSAIFRRQDGVTKLPKGGASGGRFPANTSTVVSVPQVPAGNYIIVAKATIANVRYLHDWHRCAIFVNGVGWGYGSTARIGQRFDQPENDGSNGGQTLVVTEAVASGSAFNLELRCWHDEDYNFV